MRLRLESELSRDDRESGLPGVEIAFVYEMSDDRGDLRKTTLLAANCEHLHAIDALDALTISPATELIGVFSKPLRGCKVAVQ